MGFTILLVDDSKTTRKVIARTLRLAKVPIDEIYEANNGKEALDVLGTQTVDIVLADINMPVMDGIEMIEQMSGEGLLQSIPVIMVSTVGSETRIEHLKTKGVRAYIRKPFLPEVIGRVVSDILGFCTEDGSEPNDHEEQAAA